MEDCPACRAMDQAVDDLAGEMGGEVVFVRIDARANIDSALRYGVAATPTFLLFCRGTFLMELVGVMHPDTLRMAIGDMIERRSECAGRPMGPPRTMDGYG